MRATSSRFSLARKPASTAIKATALTMLSAMSIFVWSAASAFPDRHGGPGSRDNDHSTIERRFEDLDLDEQTREAVFMILDGSRAAARALREEIRAAHEEMTALLDQDQPEEGAVLAQADVVGARMTALKKQHLSTMLTVRALLTPEQIEELRAGRPGLGRPGCSRR